jgi:isopentenyl phosphate kinase
MEKLVLIKLGGSVITDKDKPFTAKREAIRRLGREILQAQKKKKFKLIIAHGSGSFGHTYAAKYKTHEGLINKNSIKGAVLTSDVAIEINKIVMHELIEVGLLVKSFSPASFIVVKNGRASKIFCDPLIESLSKNITPVVYGDVVMDKNRGVCIFSAEKVIEVLVKCLAKTYKIEKIIFASDTDGVYDKLGKTIKKITAKNIAEIRKQIGRSSSTDVTGGMLHKVDESLQMTKKYGVRIAVINGNKKGFLRKILEGGGIEATLITT